MHLLTKINLFSIAASLLVVACNGVKTPESRSDQGARHVQRDDIVSFPIDRHAGLSAADGSPSDSQMMGDHGVLSYRNGCLFMARDGKTIGLVAPANSPFDGKTFAYRNLRLPLGKEVEFSGSVVRPSEASGLHCRDVSLIIQIAP